MLNKLLSIFILLLLSTTFVFPSSDCPSYRQDCMIEEQGSKLDMAMFELTRELSNSLFFDQNSLLRTQVFEGNFISLFINSIVIQIITIFFQLWYIWIIYLFYNTNGDIEKITQAKDSLKRFFFALGAIAISSILYLLFSTILMNFNATIAQTTGIEEIFSPDPQDIQYIDDSGLISALLRIIIVIGIVIIAIPLALFKAVSSLLLPLFTLFLFLHFAKREASSRFILELLIYALLIPGIFFLIIMILYSILSFMVVGLKSALLMGIITLFLACFIFVMLIVKISVGALIRSLIISIGNAVFQGMSRGIKKSHHH